MSEELVGLTHYDISAELYREYEFPDGSLVRIDNPIDLYLKNGGQPGVAGESHRVVDANGEAHYIPRGWVHLKWNNKPDLPRIQF